MDSDLLEGLPALSAAVLVLSAAGLSDGVIAERLGLPSASLPNARELAVRKVRRLLEPPGTRGPA